MILSMVYRKSLRMHRVSKGQAANLMNVDPYTVRSHLSLPIVNIAIVVNVIM